jgi:hypothetical protein
MATPYVGNNDYRGYLNYLSQNGNANAGVLLNAVGNDGKFSGGGSGVPLRGDIIQENSTDWNAWNAGQQAPLNTGTAAAKTSDPDTAAYYNDQANQLQGQMGQLDPQLNVGLGNISSSYNLQGNRIDEQNATAKRNYDTSTAQNDQSYSQNRNGIMQNTRANATALQRLLGMNGSGNSSASYEQAPYAAALQGSTQLNSAQQTYGNNQTGLENNWQDTQRSYKNAWDDLNTQKYQQENSLRSSIAQTKASLLDKIGQAKTNAGMALGQSFATAAAARTPYQDQVNNLLSSITQLGSQYANPVLKAQDVNFATPNLSNWYLNSGQSQAAAPQQQSGGAASDVNPTFLGLLGQQRDQYGNLIQG